MGEDSPNHSQKFANSPPIFGKHWKMLSRKKHECQERVTKMTARQN